MNKSFGEKNKVWFDILLKVQVKGEDHIEYRT